jgi:hypothetical protein
MGQICIFFSGLKSMAETNDKDLDALCLRMEKVHKRMKEAQASFCELWGDLDILKDEGEDEDEDGGEGEKVSPIFQRASEVTKKWEQFLSKL